MKKTKRRATPETSRSIEDTRSLSSRYVVQSVWGEHTDMASQLQDLTGVTVIGSYSPEHVVVQATVEAADDLQSSGRFFLEEDLPHRLIR